MKLNSKRTLLVGLAFMAICAFWQIYDSIVPLILKETFDLNDSISGIVMSLDNVLALFMLPLFGALSDRKFTKIGRRMPFILIGTVLACIFTVLLPAAEKGHRLTLFMIALGGCLLSMAVYRSPAVALMPDVTPKPLRSKANALINLMGAVGGIIMLGAIAVLAPKEGGSYFPLYILLIAFMLITTGILYKTVNEPKLYAEAEAANEELLRTGAYVEEVAEVQGKMTKEAKRSFFFMLASIFFWFMGYNAITTSFSKYANVYWGLEGGAFAYTLIIAQAAAIVSYLPIGMIATRFGRKKTILVGVVMLAVAFGACAFFKTFGGMIFFFFVLAGFGWAAINVNSLPMVVEMAKGEDSGKYTGYYYTASQAAQIITPILSGFILEYGYLLLGGTDKNAGYIFLFPYGALFVLLSFVTMLFVRHGDSKAEKKTGIEIFAGGDND